MLTAPVSVFVTRATKEMGGDLIASRSTFDVIRVWNEGVVRLSLRDAHRGVTLASAYLDLGAFIYLFIHSCIYLFIFI